MRPVPAFARVRYGDVPPAREWLKGKEHARYAIPHIDAVITLHHARLGRQRFPHLADELLEGFVQADDRALWVWRLLIHLQHIFHVADELGRLFGWNAPHLPQMRSEFVFFSVWRTVS